MWSSPEPVFAPPFTLATPLRQTAPVVFSVPHSGRNYPPEFVGASALDPLSLRRSEDAFVDLLVGPVVALGAPVLTACFPRAFLDLNREMWELDPMLLDAPPPGWANVRSARVIGGLGVIPRIVAEGQGIWRERMPLAVALHRIETLYKPYHQALRRLINRTWRNFGAAVLVDCHSMPSSGGTRRNARSPDIVLGDRYGASCSALVTDVLEALFRNAGYEVARNAPYAGGFITERYGAPAAGRHAIQIEINRGVYLDEARIEPSPGWDRLAGDLRAIFAAFVPAMADALRREAVAAE